MKDLFQKVKLNIPIAEVDAVYDKFSLKRAPGSTKKIKRKYSDEDYFNNMRFKSPSLVQVEKHKSKEEKSDERNLNDEVLQHMASKLEVNLPSEELINNDKGA